MTDESLDAVTDYADARSDRDAALPETNWAPTRASTGIAILGTAGGVAALATAVGVETGVAVGAGGAACLAVALWLLTWDRWRVPATLAASLLLVPAGVGVVAGVGYELFVAFATSFPAANPTAVVARTLRIIGVAAVLWGCTLAVFGALASVRSVATARALSRCLGLVIRLGLLPVGFALALGGHALVTNFDLAPAVGRVVGEFGSSALDWLLAPAGSKPAILPFWLVLTAATYATARALRELPTRELAGDATLGDADLADVLASVERSVSKLAVLLGVALPLAFLVGFGVPDETVRARLPPAAYDALVGVTTAGDVRHLLVRVAVAAGAVALVTTFVRKSSRASLRNLMVGYAPVLSGLGVVAGVFVAHQRVLDALLGFVVGRLSSPLSGRFRNLSSSVVEFYGPETVVFGLVAGTLVLATVGVFALRLAFALGFVSSRAPGPSLSAGGLFLAAAFAGTAGAGFPLVLAGLVTAMVVWDTGEFATTLGREVGRRARTRRVELLHALGSISVGAVAAAVATGLVGAVPSAGSAGPGTISVALLGAVGAVVLLVMALR